MKLTFNHIKEYTNYCFDTGFFTGMCSVKVVEFYDMTDSIHTHINIIIIAELPNKYGIGGMEHKKVSFDPEKEDIVIFVRTVLRQENIDKLLYG